MTNFREIICSAKAQISGMQAHGVPTSKILGYMVGRAGGYSLMGFTKKDAYNYINKAKRAKIIDGDSNAVVVYLEEKAGADPMSMASHKQTTIFGFGLVLDESVGSYKWLLENLLEVMCNKKPSIVVTNGCDSMKAAIKSVFSEAVHRLCAWHMEKNVTADVKEEGLRQCFTWWLYSDMEIDEFEAKWDDAVEEYGLQNSFWAKETFQKRMMWANAYLQDKFCAGFWTTSRMPVMTTCLDPLEKYAADVYTREIFVDAKKEIVGVGAINFVAKIRCSTTMVYTLEEYGDPGREMIVLYDRVSRKMECRCNFWSQKGIPCRHIFFVMKHEHLTQIPERLVLKRWRKDAKSLDKYAEITEVGSERGFLLRHGALHAAAQWMLYELDRGLENVRQKKAHDTVDLHDPDVVKTKGAPRVRKQGGRKRCCTRCQKIGHTKWHCNADRAFVSKAEDNKDFEATNLGSEGSSPTETCKTGFEAPSIIVNRRSISLEKSVSLYYNCALRYLFSEVKFGKQIISFLWRIIATRNIEE
ncbi:protein FAR1-RELATED SEQUENCE 5-like [Arachis ipaensis]|uniref:protein FAR1-RELATED SEQUENCE 5-like n=1 Tax=Arachis ipaensis TaxID=130454 RepID=UPI0007AF1E8B|nr:protein FAR1-RELATED SEQUENCE 5-like [Arachis ipaensis]XP_025661278.1 protein FAR1-RELATED SEQUENCE 5-like [Arachis hypogaea]